MLIRICPEHGQMVPGTKRSAMQSLRLGGGGFFASLRSAQNDMGRVHVAPLNSDWYHTFVSCLTSSPRRLTSSSPRRPVASHARLFNAKTQRGKAQSGLSAKRKAENRSLCLSYVYPFCPNYISRSNTLLFCALRFGARGRSRGVPRHIHWSLSAAAAPLPHTASHLVASRLLASSPHASLRSRLLASAPPHVLALPLSICWPLIGDAIVVIERSAFLVVGKLEG